MDPPGWNDQIRTMFGNIAHRYDFMNTLMSFGMDRLWRKRVVALADLPEDGVMLDAGAGTGRISSKHPAHTLTPASSPLISPAG